MITRVLVTFIILISSFNVFAADEEAGWPREIEKKGYKIIFYQPELEYYDDNDNILQGRMAVSIKEKNGEPIFGAAWFKTFVNTDFDTRTVSFEDVEFTDAKFPDIEEEQIEKLKKIVTKEVGKWDLVMSMDRFMVSLDEINNPGDVMDNYNNTPPKIYYRSEPAVLIMVDGGPTLKPTDDSKLMYVVNTPYLMVLDSKKGKYYLNGGEWWWESEKVESGWKQIKKPPKNVIKYSEEVRKGEDTELDSAAMKLDKAPEIIVSAEPAELITTDGELEMASVEGTELLYVKNSESDILMHVKSQQYYALISGRWFRSGSLKKGEWVYVSPDRLPDEFQKIPEDSEISSVRISIPETQESKEAILENTIPQTAEVDRKTATVKVTYDGDPQFEGIEGTDMAYAINTDKSVLLINKTYYCVDDAIWFVSPNPTGPWEVCVEVPEEVNDLPADCPLYNVKYVYVYDHTPEVVYVGYTPGYYGSYIHHGVVVYGTGYYYRPWYGAYYYPRPVTYGYGVHYNPYTGWGFSVGVSYGWISFGYRPYYRGYWGPSGYRYGYRHGYGRGYHHGYRHGYQAGRRAGYAAGYRRGQQQPRSSNVYRNRTNGVKHTGTRGSVDRSQAPRRSNNPNNVYSDRNGNVYKRDNSGNGQTRDKGSWQNQDRSGAANRAGTQDRSATRDRSNVQNRSNATQNPLLPGYRNI